MRLDHLLSKEHLPPKGGKEPAVRVCRTGVLTGGDTGQSTPGNGRRSEYTPSSGVTENDRWCGWWMMMGTLLGPEGTTLLQRVVVGCCFSTSARHDLALIPFGRAGPFFWWGLCSSGFGGGRVVVGWSLVENCTVDASILFSVVKLSRANGGCLGTRSR